MKLQLDFGSLSFSTLPALGLGDKKHFYDLIKIFEDMEIFKPLAYFGVEGEEKRYWLEDQERLLHYLKKPTSLPWVVSDTQNSKKASIKILFSFREESLILKIIKETDMVQLHKDISDLLEIFARFYRHFASKIHFGFIASILSQDEYAFEEPSPPRIWGEFNPYSLVDLIHYPEAKLAGDVNVSNSLRNSTLPEGVERTGIKDYCIVNWIGSVENENDIGDRLAVRAKWYYENADFPIDPDYNQYGDVLFSIVKPTVTSHLTFYSEMTKAGYKAIVLGNGNQYDKAQFDQLKEWVVQGKTPDGKKLSKIGLILPSREDAIAIRPVADRYGFGLVLYPGKNGNFWNPFPAKKT